MNEFLEGYYGKAAKPIRQYIDLIHDWVQEKNIHVVIWAPPSSPHLTTELLQKADALWQEAEKLVADQPDVLQRVKVSRMSVDYAIVERARGEAGNPATASSPMVVLAKQRFAPFTETLKSSGLTHLSEGQPLNFDDYRGNLARALQINP
jgi:hypothetical protein